MSRTLFVIFYLTWAMLSIMHVSSCKGTHQNDVSYDHLNMMQVKAGPWCGLMNLKATS